MDDKAAGGDVLHYIASLHSTHCHSWTVNPVQCVVLENIVAVLEWNFFGDFLYTSSTSNFNSWTRNRLPHGFMSLSTYHNQLVAVGGQHPPSDAPTNDVLTSNNGDDWQATLPGMYTKRFAASSVYVRSLAILVIAGGYGTNQYVCEVEVLLGNQWRMVDPLPKASYNVRSALYGESIYFTGGDDHKNIIYSCTCNSLCTAHDYRASNSMWTEIQAPDDTVTIATCSSQLISIDTLGVIRSYCKGTWIKATTEGDWSDIRMISICAAELSTGDVVIAHKPGGVYKLTVSEFGSLKRLQDPSISEEADNIQQDKGFSLADYPPLPMFVNDAKKGPAGFSADNEVSVIYTGESGSLDWEECGLTLLFESSKNSSEVSECPVRVLAGKTGAFRYPYKIEPASTVYHIDCPKELPAPVTLKIKHNVSEEDIQYLCFIKSKDEQPPYDYEVLPGGNFSPTFAEITVKNFSFFLLAILRKYRVKGALSIREKSYSASLHCSLQPTLEDSGYSWNVYVSAVKNCSCFKQSIKKFIKEIYEDDAKLVVKKIFNFTDMKDSIIASTSFEHSLEGTVILKPCGSPSIKKMHINRYVDATLPHIKYDLQVPPQQSGASLDIKITLSGLQEPENYLCLHLAIPQWSSPQLTALPHKNFNVSSLEQESSIRSGCAFKMKNLHVLHIEPDQQLHLIEEISPQWKEAGDLLGLRSSYIRVIEDNNSKSIVNCCREVMVEWLSNPEGTYNHPPSWEGLCDLLKSLKLSTAAEHIQNSVLK